MKHIIIIGDGMADVPTSSLGNKTLLQYAQTPNMDRLAALGRTGVLKTVPKGFTPGSEVANLSILGYEIHKVYEGRGALEAAAMGVELQPGDLAIRCNLITIQKDTIKSHSAGLISTEEAAKLIDFINKNLGNKKVRFYAGTQYRHLLVIKNGSKKIDCAPPHDHLSEPFMPLMAKATAKDAEETVNLINDLIIKSQELLANHPVNLQRIKDGKLPANSIWPWSPGYKPNMKPLAQIYPAIRRGSVISASYLINGIGIYAGLNRIHVEGATGLYDTNYGNKVKAALNALLADDFVYLHIDASDEAGHEGDLKKKLLTIENLDRYVVGPIYNAVKDWDNPVAISVLPDHPTPYHLRTHTADPVPFLIYYPNIIPDNILSFNEISCKEGAYGELKGNQFMNEFMTI